MNFESLYNQYAQQSVLTGGNCHSDHGDLHSDAHIDNANRDSHSDNHQDRG